MPQVKATKFVKSFVKGLITEAGYLTYPEDASTDELNTVLHLKGNRSRRLGIDFEDDSTNVVFSPFTEDDVTNEFFWRSVDNKANLNFLVMQVGYKVYFFDASVSPLSEGIKSFSLNLLSYKSPTATTNDVRFGRVDFAVGKGYLFVVGDYIDPLSIEYDQDTDTISTLRIIIQTRDFDGVDDGLTNDAEPTYLSNTHHYNLRNQGWVRTGTNSVQPNYPTEPDVSTPVQPEGGDTNLPGDAGGGGGTNPPSDGYGGGSYNPRTGDYGSDREIP